VRRKQQAKKSIEETNMKSKYTILLFLLIMNYSCKVHRENNGQGSYGYDRAFLLKYHNDLVEICDSSGDARLLICPAYQGRVMTSTLAGDSGFSFGWINHKLIESGILQKHMNAYGGEERLWLGPEGGQFSFYFDAGKEFVFTNWQVPSVIDTEPFSITRKEDKKVVFEKSTALKNYSGNIFGIRITRSVEIIDHEKAGEFLHITIPCSLRVVAYQSKNVLINQGNMAWTRETGMPSLWMLCMFVPTPGTTVIIPYQNNTDDSGSVINDRYFGTVPNDRLRISDNLIFFKADGKHRGKIGLSYKHAKDLLGSFDETSGSLTILQFEKPLTEMPYVNSQWQLQQQPFVGDMINSYNDGPVEDGTQMGPFYELESSSPAAELEPGESIEHTQRIFHFQGSEHDLDLICRKLFGVNIKEIKEVFQSE
jgi:hypothetical protein